jgi:NAD(P)-dependent dehydrogenase (short-subunit alcohol dehydrogenase family)
MRQLLDGGTGRIGLATARALPRPGWTGAVGARNAVLISDAAAWIAGRGNGVAGNRSTMRPRG